MIGIIQDWLFNQLGKSLNINNLAENNIFQDGCVLAEVLQNYGLLNSNYGTNITPTSDFEQCKQNLQLLKPIFKMLKINYNDDIILNIANGKTTTTLKLLYELYICLENKQHLYFIKHKTFGYVQKNLFKTLEENKFTVNVEEPGMPHRTEETCFELPLIQNKDIIEWYKNKYNAVKTNLDVRLHKLKDGICCDKETDIKVKKHSCSCAVDVYESLPELGTFLKCSNLDNLLDYEQFIALYKVKQHHDTVKQCFEKNLQNELLNQTWNKVLEKQNEIYNSIFSEILLKQSQYEKQILTKLIKTSEQVKTQSDSQIQANKSIINEHLNQINCDFKLKEEFDELKCIHQNEQRRVLELHKKLYKEKQDLIKKRRYVLCNDTVDAIIDLAMNVSEYEQSYGVPVPKRLWGNWKQLFYKSQPIHTPLQNIEKGNNIDYDEAIVFEREQDEQLNENDVDEYLYTCGGWYYSDLCNYQGDMNENCLAFIIYRLLSVKYPPPPSPLPADLPPFKLAGVLINFYSPDSIEKLKILLSKPRVHVFDTEVAIKKCISTFQEETAPPISVKVKGKRKESKSKSPKRKSKVLSKSKKGENKSNKKKLKVQTTVLTDLEEKLVNLIDKETQTSIIQEIDEKILERSKLGLIGEEVFNKIKGGEKIDDTMLIEVIIEYLKTLKEFEGWLLLNYPQTLNLASLLELAITGKLLPIEDYVLEENKTAQVQDDEFSEKRKSKLLHCPLSNNGSSSFKTHFNVFIRAAENVNEGFDIHSKDSKTNSTVQNNKESVPSNSEETKEMECSLIDGLELFYKDQSIFQEFSYDTFDLATLKQLVRTILKEEGPEAKNSIELFGEEFLDMISKKGKKKNPKGKNVPPKKTVGKDKKKSSKDKTLSAKPLLNTNEDNAFGADKEMNEFENDKIKTEPLGYEELQTKVKSPDDEDWKPISLSLNAEVAIMLATIWENIENCYINNLKDINFENRVINLRLIPYATFVKEEIEQIMNKPDMKPNLVNHFQNYYNSIEDNLRSLPQVKNQLHCKVLEMQQSLWELADDRKKETESKRREIVFQNWLANELCMLINNYLSLVQTEYDRSFETLKLVSDYYLTMLDKGLSANNNVLLDHNLVTKVPIESLLTIQDRTLDQKPTYDPSGDSISVETKRNFIAQSLITCYEKEKSLNLINDFLLDEIELAVNRLSSVSHTFYRQIKTEEDLLDFANKKVAREKTATSKKSVLPKSVNDKSKKKSSVSKPEEKNLVYEQDVKDDSSVELLLTEWKYVVDTEIKRFNFRMELIKARACEEIMEFFCYLESVFCELYNSTLSKYDSDIKNIDKLCEYVKTAIEEETPLSQNIVLKLSSFFIDVTTGFKGESQETPVKDLFEEVHDYYFTIDQLNKLQHIFKIAGPYGVIRKQPFCYILQDLMLLNAGDNQPHLPKMWSLLSESQLIVVIDTIFGPEFAIDWRDFIIYNLEIPYPSIEDILSLRNQFLSYDYDNTEIILLENFETVKLWFEEDLPSNPQEGLRIMMIKRLLSDMFKIDENSINYSALLLYFCKDFNANTGLRKALSLSLGKNVIMSKNELNELLTNEAEIKETVYTLLTDIVNSIVFNREGVLIYEVFDYESEGSLTSDKTDASSTSSYQTELLSDSLDQESHKSSLTKSENQSSHKNFTPSFCLGNSNIRPKPWVSRIPVASVITVLNASFLHQDKSYSLRNHYLSCLEEEADEEHMIEAPNLVTLSCIQKLFALTNKFKISLPTEIVRKCLNV